MVARPEASVMLTKPEPSFVSDNPKNETIELTEVTGPDVGRSSGYREFESNGNDTDIESMSPTSSLTVNLMTQLDDASQFPDGGVELYLVVLGAFLGLLGGFGILNSTGVVQAYLQNNQLAGVNVSTVTWIFSIYTFLSFFGGFIVGPLFDYAGSRIPLMISIVLFMAGIFGCANSTKVWQFILSFGICVGMGTCCLMTPLLGVVSHWFLRKRAVTIGIAMAGASVGGIIYPLMLRSLYPKVGFAWAMRIVGFICLSLLILSLFLSKDRSEQIRHNNLRKQGWTDEQIDNLSVSAKDIMIEIKNSIDFYQFKDKVYLLLTISILFNELSLFLVYSYYASYAMAQGVEESTAYILVTILSAAGAPGRYLPGFLADRYGRFNVMLGSLCLMTILIFVLWIPFADNLKALYSFAGLYGFSCGTTLSLTPVCFGQISKTENFGKRYGTGYCVVSFALLVGLPVGGAIIGDNGDTLGYHHMTIFSGVLAALGLLTFTLCRYLMVGWKLVKV